MSAMRSEREYRSAQRGVLDTSAQREGTPVNARAIRGWGWSS